MTVENAQRAVKVRCESLASLCHQPGFQKFLQKISRITISQDQRAKVQD